MKPEVLIFTLDLKNDTFPITIEYKGLKLLIEKAWYENGYLHFNLDPHESSAEAGMFSHLRLNIKGSEQPIKNSIAKDPGHKGITQVSIAEDERDVYEIVTLYNSYLVKVNQKLKINLKQR